MVTFEDDEFICKVAENVKQAKELIEAGYEYVCDMDNLKLFRKHKQPSNFASSPEAGDSSRSWRCMLKSWRWELNPKHSGDITRKSHFLLTSLGLAELLTVKAVNNNLLVHSPARMARNFLGIGSEGSSCTLSCDNLFRSIQVVL